MSSPELDQRRFGGSELGRRVHREAASVFAVAIDLFPESVEERVDGIEATIAVDQHVRDHGVVVGEVAVECGSEELVL